MRVICCDSFQGAAGQTTHWFARLALVFLSLGGISLDAKDPPPTRPSPVREQLLAPSTAKVEARGLHNVFRITAKLISGSSPDGDDGFRSLQRLGIRTIISVDGSRPDVEAAHRFGMRYVHIPFGYDGIPREQLLRLAKAVRDLPGPIYLHCHQGQHRGPTAAAAVHLCLDDTCTVEQALAEMHRAGTDPHYCGLYAVPSILTRPTREQLDRVNGDFPEVAQVPDLAQCMVGVDERWTNLALLRNAGWRTPADHADLESAHEALMLVEQLREAKRLAQQERRGDEFRRRLSDAEARAEKLEKTLRAPHEDESRKEAATEAFQATGAACTCCHAKYRDVPQPR